MANPNLLGEPSALPNQSGRLIETRSPPSSLAATHRGFTFFVADPISSAARFADGGCGSQDRTAVSVAGGAHNFLRRNKPLANL
jgi:hypothetical protein